MDTDEITRSTWIALALILLAPPLAAVLTVAALYMMEMLLPEALHALLWVPLCGGMLAAVGFAATGGWRIGCGMTRFIVAILAGLLGFASYWVTFRQLIG